MAVDPEPVVHVGLELDEANSQQNLSLVGQQKSFSFSTFASSSIFAKPRQRKVKKKPVNVQKYYSSYKQSFFKQIFHHNFDGYNIRFFS